MTTRRYLIVIHATSGVEEISTRMNPGELAGWMKKHTIIKCSIDDGVMVITYKWAAPFESLGGRHVLSLKGPSKHLREAYDLMKVN